MVTAPAAADQFQAYAASHLVVLGVLLVGAVALARVGRSLRGSSAEDLFSKAFAIAVAALLPVQLGQLISGSDLLHSLPLHLCDLAWFATIYALWSRRPVAVALTYYWGLTLTTQAVLTPDLGDDFPDIAFIAFWALHLLIVWAPVYLTWGLGLRPSWRGYRSTVAITLGWAVTAFVVNLALGTNYGYLNAKPDRSSILDLLGPWPVYVVAEVVIALSVWALITWPWERTARHRVDA
jgi:hypothetical integral membrane protein (TIGR02206 family)